MRSRPIDFAKGPNGSYDPRRRVARAAFVALLWLIPSAAMPACAMLGSNGAETDLIDAITQAVGGTRIIEPRLTGTFDHQPCVVPPMSDGVQQPACGSPDGSLAAATRASTLLAEAARGEGTGNVLYASGLWDLLWHEVDGGIDRAITKLHGAVAADPTNAAALTSLTAAYVVRAQSRNRLTDLFQALDLAEEAVALDPTSPPALFNHALVLERLFFNARAIEAWNRYLAVDVAGPWADEARRARDRLAADVSSPERAGLLAPTSTRLIGEHASPTTAQDAIVEQHLPAWAQLVLDGENGRARELLDRIEEAAAAIFVRSRDSLLVEEIARLQNAREQPDRRDIARTYIGLARGIRALKNLEIQRARAELKDAGLELSRMSNPLAVLAGYHLIVVDFQNLRYPSVLRHTADLVGRLGPDRSILGMRLQSLRGLVAGVTAQHLAAVSAYSAAAAIARRIGDRDSEAASAAALAVSSALFGDTAKAWSHRYRALSLSRAGVRPRTLVKIRLETVRAAARRGFTRAARHLADEIVVASRALPPVTLSYALNNRARSRLEAGNVAGALEDLAISRRQLDNLEDASIRTAVEDEINLLLGEALAESQPGRASEILLAVDQHFEARGHVWMSILSKTSLANAQYHLGQNVAANSTLERALRALEVQAPTLGSSEEKLGFANQAREMLDRLILLRAVELDDPLGALDVIARIGELAADQGSAASADTTSGPAVAETSGDGQTRVVIYRVLAGSTLAWVAAPKSTQFRRLQTDEDQLESAVRRLQAAATANHAPAVRTELAWLYEALVAPIRDLLGDGVDLQIIPDRTLHQVPFSALLDSSTGKFLVESRSVVVAPHGSLRRGASPGAGAAPRAVLVVADPSLSPDIASRLGRLPNARREAIRVASLYERATRLLGPEARGARVQAELGSHDVVHLAVHAAPPAHDGAAGYLVLAGTPDDDTPGLSAATIAELRIDGHPVVVLASCDTAGGRLGPNAGAASLAWGFLQAGASAVVASLWDVDDDATEPLMYEFHRRLAAGAAPAEALRRAQLSALHEPDDELAALAQWAAFQVFIRRTP